MTTSQIPATASTSTNTYTIKMKMVADSQPAKHVRVRNKAVPLGVGLLETWHTVI